MDSVNKKLQSYHIILGSQSPRRRALIEMMDIKATTCVIDADESFPLDMNVHDVAEFLAEKKSLAFGALQHRDLLITSDTTVLLNNEILNKPANAQEAAAMLHALSGNDHIVSTGVCIRSTDKVVKFREETVVSFKRLTEEEIAYYVTKYEPLDKAGAYGIQEWIGAIGVKSIHGSYFNVMGLPTQRLYKELCEF